MQDSEWSGSGRMGLLTSMRRKECQASGKGGVPPSRTESGLRKVRQESEACALLPLQGDRTPRKACRLQWEEGMEGSSHTALAVPARVASEGGRPHIHREGREESTIRGVEGARWDNARHVVDGWGGKEKFGLQHS
ncbi:hypothetical protein NDU88_001071 [Pleurodeles waltl]|uniref:Uncharacterized protein n=1 Tax=Pleurodeles waltl TaxID=8319 RepID=A0AAV7VZ47_PLEWA|nr:hypothetical protein NDU88_001071 [Pleurodeles waltl]